MSVGESQRIRWTKGQRKLILDEAVRLRIQNPSWSNLRLIRESQKILPVEERRNLAMVSWKTSFKWFADGVDEAIRNDQTPSTNGKYHESENLSSEEPLDLSVVTILSTLVKAMEELREETTKGLPIGIVGRLDDLQLRLNKIEDRVERFLNQGLLVRLVPATAQNGLPVQPVVHQEIPVAPIQKSPLPQESQQKTRKPRVVVLNTDSGHVRNGIETGTREYVSVLKFQDTHGVVTPEFRDFDYVLAYKKTSIQWIEAAKKFYPPGKFKALFGGALPVAEAIKVLPRIKITD